MAVGDAYVFPGFLTPVLTLLFFQSHRLLFSHASAEVRGENTPERKVASTWDRTHNHQVMSPTLISEFQNIQGRKNKKKRRVLGRKKKRRVLGRKKERRVLGRKKKRRVLGRKKKRRVLGRKKKRRVLGRKKRRVLGRKKKRRVLGRKKKRRVLGRKKKRRVS